MRWSIRSRSSRARGAAARLRALALLGGLLPRLLLAQDAGSTRAAPIEQPLPGPEDAATAESRALSEQAKLAYDGGQFKEALRLYGEAYRKRPLPGFLFNLGQCHRQLGNYERASFFFGRYLDVFPDAPNAELARSLLDESVAKARAVADDEKARREKELADLRTALARAEEQNAAAKVLAAAPPAPPPPLLKQWWFWTAVGGAAVIAVTTAVAAQPHPRDATLGTVDLR